MKPIRRRRLSYANVVATFALVFAMSGGALAASRYVINSSKQINPRVLKKLNGPIGASGPAGSTGEAGKTGATGATGAAGAQGAQGSPGSAAGWAYVKADGTVEGRGGAVAISIDRVKAGEYCLLMTPKQQLRAPILATLQGEDSTAGLISVNSAFGSDCNQDDGIGVFTKNIAGAAADHEFVVALMQSRVDDRGPA